MKNYQKNSIYPSVPFSCMKNEVKPTVYMKTHKGHLKCLSLELHLNPWFKWAPLNLLMFALAQTTSHIHAMIMHHIVAYAFFYWLSTPFLLDRSCSEECLRVPVRGAVFCTLFYQASKPPCSFRYNPTLSLLLSFIALGQQRFNCYFMLR